MTAGVPLLLTALLVGCVRVSESVSCYGGFNKADGTCVDYLGDDVSENDCCLNLQYGFTREEDAPCEACYPAEWNPWSAWGPCSVTCTEGVQQRRRACYGQGSCAEDEKLENKLETRVCSMQDCCPEDGGWSNWSPWSACTVTCLSGTMERRRECNNPTPTCGGTCHGTNKEIANCNTGRVCPTHGSWSSWGAWSECSSSCVQEAARNLPTQVRRQQCNNPPPSTDPPGNDCPGTGSEARDCSGLPFCPVDGQWSEWQKEGDCSVTCGVGREIEKRLCNNPAPRHNGRYCVGSDTRSWTCNTGVPCPVDGHWSEWSEWNACERLGQTIKCTKKSGIQSRTRRCEQPRDSGKPCTDSTIDHQACYNINLCLFKEGNFWSEWSEWSLCKPPCGESTRSRTRKCQPLLSGYKNETGIQKVTKVFFWGTPNVLCEELNGQRRRVTESQDCKNVYDCDELQD